MPSLFLFLMSFLFGAGASGVSTPPLTGTPQVATSNAVVVSSCYVLEEGTQLTVVPDMVVSDCQEEVVGKTYVRIRQGVKIVNAKIAEGRSNWGTCQTTEPSGYGALRKIGPPSLSDPAQIGDIFWEDLNYKREDLKEFLLILTDRDDKYHTFDVYINHALKDNIPDYVKNCQETGGLVPVVEGPTTPTFPPQSISFVDADFNALANQLFDSSCCQVDYDALPASERNQYYIRIEEKTKTDAAVQIGVLQKDIRGEVRLYDVYYHSGVVYLVSQTGQADSGKSWIYNASETKPPQTVQSEPSLQLGALKFITTSSWTWATPECKPAIYLYPEEPTEVSVKVVPKGRITVSDPEHGENGWRVIAYPDGTIHLPPTTYHLPPTTYHLPLTTHHLPLTTYHLPPTTYPYLYYETELDKVKAPDEGWIVEKDNLEDFFNFILPQLGLNHKEQQDFLSYWLPKLEEYLSTEESRSTNYELRTQKPQSTLNFQLTTNNPQLFVGLIDRQELDRVEQIEFFPQPDTFIRVRFYFEKIDNKSSKFEALNSKQVLNSKFQFLKQFDILDFENWSLFRISDFGFRISSPERRGFTAVDWGGILEGGSCGVKAKSQ